MKLYATITGCSGVEGVQVTQAYNSSTIVAIIQCESHTLEIGDSIVVDIGYSTSHNSIFTGYVKQIERKIPEDVYTITASDIMVRAIEFFIVPPDPDHPLTYTNIPGENLVTGVLGQANLTAFDTQATTFTFATDGSKAEVKLVSAYDYTKAIADLLGWHLWATVDGTIHFRNRKPFVMGADRVGVEPGWVADGNAIHTFEDTDILSLGSLVSDKDLRNRVVVFGSGGIHAEASAVSPYLPNTPNNFYKTVVFGDSTLVTEQADAQKIADYNLHYLNNLTYSYNLTVKGDQTINAYEIVAINSIQFGSYPKLFIYSLEQNWSKAGFITNLVLR